MSLLAGSSDFHACKKKIQITLSDHILDEQLYKAVYIQIISYLHYEMDLVANRKIQA